MRVLIFLLVGLFFVGTIIKPAIIQRYKPPGFKPSSFSIRVVSSGYLVIWVGMAIYFTMNIDQFSE